MKLADIETDFLIRELIDRGYQVTKILKQRPPTPKLRNRDNVLVINLEMGSAKKCSPVYQCSCCHPLCPLCNRTSR